jgi:hypothetical protein
MRFPELCAEEPKPVFPGAQSTTAMMVVVGGKVLFDRGAAQDVSVLASARGRRKAPVMPHSVHPLITSRAGNWNGKQLIDSNWFKFMTTLVTQVNELFLPAFATRPNATTGDSASASYGGSGIRRVCRPACRAATSTARMPGWAREDSSSSCFRRTTWWRRTK